MRIKARGVSKGFARGEALVSKSKISFLGDVDAKSGVVVDKNSDIYGESVANKVLVFPSGKGSTVGTYVLLQLKKNGVAPLAIINEKTEVIIAVGAIIAEIPLVDMPEVNVFEILKSGDIVTVNATEGWIEIE
ncbi:protein of unknown function DUF126 [Ferroglobus placidus DSM 10642]|uniref:Phosphomevalonate dehydratase small subunit n=1 Tax=Ferroglobus placidus (strain DSM 10642 / AEDII12DO) TaxID=589924 RepID=D3S160_FERPA|nr:DUF126 domain-containing protein [Ferroglobus placidus]ADC64296.1 protein of unknown function DUF126 [Ferroglobus placidus DSM 10642]